MKELNLEELSPESAERVTEVLNTIIGEDQSVRVKREGKLLYDVSKGDILPDNEPYVSRPDEKPSEVARRIFADGPLMDEKYQDMPLEKFRQKAWGGRGVR